MILDDTSRTVWECLGVFLEEVAEERGLLTLTKQLLELTKQRLNENREAGCSYRRRVSHQVVLRAARLYRRVNSYGLVDGWLLDTPGIRTLQHDESSWFTNRGEVKLLTDIRTVRRRRSPPTQQTLVSVVVAALCFSLNKSL